jgi:hypothetical protein
MKRIRRFQYSLVACFVFLSLFAVSESAGIRKLEQKLQKRKENKPMDDERLNKDSHEAYSENSGKSGMIYESSIESSGDAPIVSVQGRHSGLASSGSTKGSRNSASSHKVSYQDMETSKQVSAASKSTKSGKASASNPKKSYDSGKEGDKVTATYSSSRKSKRSYEKGVKGSSDKITYDTHSSFDEPDLTVESSINEPAIKQGT